MKFLSKPNFILTLSDLLVNLSAGWFGAILILPGVWSSHNLYSNLVRYIVSLSYGSLCLYLSFYLKEKTDAN